MSLVLVEYFFLFSLLAKKTLSKLQRSKSQEHDSMLHSLLVLLCVYIFRCMCSGFIQNSGDHKHYWQ